MKHIMAILISVFSPGSHGNPVDFEKYSPCHRTTAAHFLNKGKWDDARLENINKKLKMKYMMTNDSALMFPCSPIEYIGRRQKLSRTDVVQGLKRENVARIYKYADVLHCEPIIHVAQEYVRLADLKAGDYDNVKKCRYGVPDYWAIGEGYERLIEDVSQSDTIETLFEVYSSWISEAILNYNSDFFYQPRDYIKECYLAGEVL